MKRRLKRVKYRLNFFSSFWFLYYLLVFDKFLSSLHFLIFKNFWDKLNKSSLGFESFIDFIMLMPVQALIAEPFFLELENQLSIFESSSPSSRISLHNPPIIEYYRLDTWMMIGWKHPSRVKVHGSAILENLVEQQIKDRITYASSDWVWVVLFFLNVRKKLIHSN